MKPDNLLVFSTSEDCPINCKLSDFGSVTHVGLLSALMGDKQDANAGTAAYMAPEVIEDSAYTQYSFPADVFSFGMLFWQMITEQVPYDPKEFKRPWDIASFVKAKKRLPIPSDVPTTIASLMRSCWEHDPINRPLPDQIISTLQALLQHTGSPRVNTSKHQ